LLLAFVSAQAQEQTPIQYRTEANYLAHFASFVEWPASAFPSYRAPIQLCVFAGADFGTSLRELTKEVKVNGRDIEVRSMTTLAQSRSCHILFIGGGNVKRYGEILGLIQDLPVLTVGETEDFLDAGGVVNFVNGEVLQIDINMGAADHAHLKIRAQLAAMARKVSNIAKTQKP
jgi:hypothetical protein